MRFFCSIICVKLNQMPQNIPHKKKKPSQDRQPDDKKIISLNQYVTKEWKFFSGDTDFLTILYYALGNLCAH